MLVHIELKDYGNGNCTALEQLSILNCSAIDRINMTCHTIEKACDDLCDDEVEEQYSMPENYNFSDFGSQITVYIAGNGKGQDSSDSRSRRSSATWWRRAAAIQGGTAPALSVNHQSFTPPFETAVKRQTYEPLFISFQKYNRIDDRDGGDNHQSVTADRTSFVCEAARDKVGALL
ncbi:hypothetical protein ACJJTC_006952 [Scirpophaga incertulas]